MVRGLCCALCGVFFRKPHGYPVLCAACWKQATIPQRSDYQPATIAEA